jgi:hypothetical protein
VTEETCLCHAGKQSYAWKLVLVLWPGLSLVSQHTDWLHTFPPCCRSHGSGTNQLGYELNHSSMTRTTTHPCNNDANDDEDELAGIVSPLVVHRLGFIVTLSITHS